MGDSYKESLLKLHLSILLAGLTGVFGKIITLSEGVLVWYRLLLTSLFLFVFLFFAKKLTRISFRDFRRIGLVGTLLALHWVFFYGSIKASNVSIGVICFSLIGFFTAIFEPLILHKKFSARELLYSLIALAGVMLIFSFDIRYRLGVGLGIISSALASLFTIATKRISGDYKPHTILLYEMIAGFGVITLLLPLYAQFVPMGKLVPNGHDIIYLLIFVILCTIVLQLLQIQVLRKLSAFTVNLSYNLEPIYSIIIAMLFLGEGKEVGKVFYGGLGLIIFSILLQMWSSYKEAKVEVRIGD